LYYTIKLSFAKLKAYWAKIFALIFSKINLCSCKFQIISAVDIFRFRFTVLEELCAVDQKEKYFVPRKNKHPWHFFVFKLLFFYCDVIIEAWNEAARRDARHFSGERIENCAQAWRV